jgi:hypothetical protein
MKTSTISDGATVNIYWPCKLIEIPGLDAIKDRYAIEIDGKRVGDIASCESHRFESVAGTHTIRTRPPWPILDLSGALGIQGPKYNVLKGRPLYIRLTFQHYVEMQETSSQEALRDIAAITNR